MSNKSGAFLAEMREIMLSAASVPLPALNGVKFVCRTSAFSSKNCFDQPFVCLAVQGGKTIQAGPFTFATTPGKLLVTCVEMPSASSILNASPENPYLSICVYLDRTILADILSEMPEKTPGAERIDPSAWLTDADDTFLDAFLRLARLLAKPDHARILSPLVIREIHFLLLASASGGCLHNLYMRGARDSRIIDIISWLKHNLTSAISMDTLAEMAHMSTSSFYRHFKTITGFSPLQYQKKLRLYEAQRLMLAEDMRVAEAAAEVGYESVTQFNREYRRMFGQPPKRDITRLRGRLAG